MLFILGILISLGMVVRQVGRKIFVVNFTKFQTYFSCYIGNFLLAKMLLLGNQIQQ